jgi:hypothetical protein
MGFIPPIKGPPYYGVRYRTVWLLTKLWLRTLPVLVGIAVLSGVAFLVGLGLGYVLRDIASTPHEGLRACLVAAGADQELRDRCLHPPIPWLLRQPARVALFVALLAAPFAWRWLRPPQRRQGTSNERAIVDD